MAAIALALAAVLPSLFFVLSAFADDETASRTAGSLAAWLVLIEVVVGGLIATVAWAVGRASSATARAVTNAFLLVAAGGWGLVTGFLGGVAIAFERHPTWDDA